MGVAEGFVEASRCAQCSGQVEADWAMCGWCGARIDGRVPVPGLPGGGPMHSVGFGDVIGRGPLGSAAVGSETGVEFSGELPGFALPKGTVLIDRFRVDAVLGRGGFGVTYRAWDLRLARAVALKEMFPTVARREGTRVVVDEFDFGAAREKFHREASALARFSHPGIVRVFEVVEANNTVYMVMELIVGRSMSEVLAERGAPLEVDEVLELVARVGDALEVVHGSGMLHRDVNPSNIMLAANHRFVLIDFGLARRFGDEVSRSMTRAVTPGYAPPEQYAGSVTSGPSCDVFGLAATAYKLLTGVTPTNVFDRQAGVVLQPPMVLNEAVPRVVSAGVLDGMELDAGHRPASARAFVDRLGLHGFFGAAIAGDVPDAVADLRGDPLATIVPVGPVATIVPEASDATAGATRGFSAVPEPTWAQPRDATAVPAQVAPLRVDAVPEQVLPLRSVPIAPWHDGSPPIVGPDGDRWRGWVTWPVAAALVAFASASPVLVGAALGLVLLPLVATWGDGVVHRHRQHVGAQRRRWHDWQSSSVAPVRFLRNVFVGALRAAPAAGVVAIGVVGEHALSSGAAASVWRSALIRVCGVTAALILLVPSRSGGRWFRSDLGVTTWSRWAMEGRRRPGTRAAMVWAIAIGLCAFGVWLNPELWPFT